MEKLEKIEELKAMLENLKEIAELYNGMVPAQEKVEVVPQQLNDVSNVFVCVYNGNSVGFFKKKNWHSDISSYRVGDYYDAGSIYEGVDSDYIALKTTHEGYGIRNRWEEVGRDVTLSSGTYIANCSMSDGMSFDDMRLIMYSAGDSEPYQFGKATSAEMLEVLKYAYNYYGLESKKLKR